MNKYTVIPLVMAEDLPNDILDWCVENNISTHYQSDVVCFISDESNPLINWLKNEGFNCTNKYQYIGIKAT